MILTREKIESLQAGREIDEMVDFYLNHSNPIELSMAEYTAPISSDFLFNGEWLKFSGTPPFSENDRIAEHAAAMHNPFFKTEKLPSGQYRITLLTSSGRQRLKPIVANTKALALCQAGLIGKVSSV